MIESEIAIQKSQSASFIAYVTPTSWRKIMVLKLELTKNCSNPFII